MAIMSNNPRAVFIAAAAAAVLFVVALIRQHPEHREKVTAVLSNTAEKAWPFRGGKTFYEIAKEKGTDKVTDHSYQHMYEKYLPALRNKRIKMLEIGLGCDMVSSLSIYFPPIIIPCQMLPVVILSPFSARLVFSLFVALAPPSLTPI